MSGRLVFETHAISVDNELGRATGWLPGRLSREGEGLAEKLGHRRPASDYSAVYTSDLHRAVQTAELAYGTSSIEIIRDPRLRECNYGDLNGMPVVQLDTLRQQHIDRPFPGGESYREVVTRVADFLEQLRHERHGQRIIVIGHSATRWALDHLLRSEPLEALVSAPFGWQEGWEYPWA